MLTNLLRIACTTATFAVILLGAAAEGQTLAPAGPGFQAEWTPRPGARPTVEGYVHNGRIVWVSSVRVRVEVLNADGSTMEETFGWVTGNVRPGGSGYFLVKVKQLGTSYRVSVVSFDIVPLGGA